MENKDKPLKPESVKVNKNPEIHTAEVPVPDGHVLLVSVDDKGNEKPGTHFIATERMYNRFYTNESKFKVKKKGNPSK